MNNTKLEDIRRKLQSRIKVFSNGVSSVFEDDLSKEQWKAVRATQVLDKKLMAALIHLQRENKELKEECNLYADSVMRRFMGSNVRVFKMEESNDTR